MAIYHFSGKIISRSNGHSSVAASAYRAGVCLSDERTGVVHDYQRKQGVEFEKIIFPIGCEWAQDRNFLWNEVEATEKRKDSQLARELNIALPRELTREENKKLICSYVQKNFVDRGMIADIAIHVDRESSNPHAHVMLTMREATVDGFGRKEREWNRSELLAEWRAEWAQECNLALERAGHEAQIDHRTLQEQGLDREPQVHLGKNASALERQGIETDLGNINREIEKKRELERELAEVEQELSAQEFDPWAETEHVELREQREFDPWAETEQQTGVSREPRRDVEIDIEIDFDG